MTDLTGARTRGPRLETRAWLRGVGREGPEQWLWGVAVAGWLVLVVADVGWSPFPASGGDEHAGMAMGGGGSAHPWDGWTHHLLLWVAMVAATMLPLVAANLRSVGLRSPRGRRTRATLDVAAGWSAVWLAAGVVLTLAVLPAMAVVPAALTIGATCAVAIAWQLTEVKRVAVARCHRTFAPPLGRPAAAACARFGTGLGRDCLLTCWPSMVLMTVAGHQVLVVLPLAWLSWRDTRLPHNRPGVRTSVLVLASTGAVAILLSA